MSMLFGGGQHAGSPPVFHKTDIPALETQALQYDTAAADRAFAQFESGKTAPLMPALQASINDAGRQMEGGLGDMAGNALASAGLGSEERAFQGADEFKKAELEDRPVLSMEARDRNYFESLLGGPYPTQPLAAGLTGANVAQIGLADIGTQQSYDQTLFQNQLNNYYAGVGQLGQLIGAGGEVALGGAKLYNQSQSGSGVSELPGSQQAGFPGGPDIAMYESLYGNEFAPIAYT